MEREKGGEIELAKRFFYPEMLKRLERSNPDFSCQDKSLVRRAVSDYFDLRFNSVGLSSIFDDKYYSECYRNQLEQFGYEPPVNE